MVVPKESKKKLRWRVPEKVVPWAEKGLIDSSPECTRMTTLAKLLKLGSHVCHKYMLPVSLSAPHWCLSHTSFSLWTP